jgi:methyl-accepting chemotaxis protein
VGAFRANGVKKPGIGKGHEAMESVAAQMAHQTGDGWKSHFLAAPVGLGLAGAMLLLALAGPSGESLFWSALLVGSATVLGRHLSVLHRRELEKRLPAKARERSPLGELFSKVCPVWERQIATCRQTADDAVTELARNFSGMVERLEATLSASKNASSAMGGAGTGIVAVINRSEVDLAKVIDTLRALQRSTAAILGRVGEYAGNLTEMAADVQQIALQIRLLSLNGAIEAARAGEPGKAFAVVVGEMRRLSSESAEVGTRISKKVEVVNQALADMVLDRDVSKGRDAASIEGAKREIDAVLDRFKGLTAGLHHSVEIMERESEALKERISGALTTFQFQDRVSQILAHVSDGMSRLGTSVARGEDDLADSGAWIDEIASGYTADEEFDNLRGTRSDKRAEHGVRFF